VQYVQFINVGKENKVDVNLVLFTF